MWEEIERTRNVALEWLIFPSAEKNVPQTATQAQRPPLSNHCACAGNLRSGLEHPLSHTPPLAFREVSLSSFLGGS